MMKKAYLLIAAVTLALTATARPESWTDPWGVSDGYGGTHSIWVSEMIGEDPSILIVPGGVFDMPATLKELVNRVNQSNERGMTNTEFGSYVQEFTQYLKENPRYTKQIYVQLGNLYNYVRPTSLRNPDRAYQFYHYALPLTNIKSDQSQLYLLMASCFNGVGTGQNNINEMTLHLMKAAEIDGRYASGIGDIIMCGWGTFCDIYLAASFYTIAMRNGDAGSAAKLRILKYSIENPNWTVNDSLGFYAFEQYLYHSRLVNDDDRAFSSLISACQRGFVPAFYYAAYFYQKQRPDLSVSERRKGMFRWLSLGSAAGYTPCIYGLAQITDQYTIDSAKGDIYQPNADGTYSTANRKTCAKQAFELFQRAAKLGSTNAMFALGERYLKGNEFGYPKANLEKALYYYVLCAEMGYSIGSKRVEELSAAATDKEQFKAILKKAANEATAFHQQTDKAEQKVFEEILKSEKFSAPMMVPTSYNMNHPDIDVTNNNDELNKAMLARNYENCYKLYMDKMAHIARVEKGFMLSNATFYQERLRELRMRCEARGINANIHESMWETWDGE